MTLPKRPPHRHWTLYHVTPAVNSHSISQFGILANRATGARKAVYLVDYQRVLWALSHVSVRWMYKVSDLLIYKCHVLRTQCRRVNQRKGLYYTMSNIDRFQWESEERWLGYRFIDAITFQPEIPF